MIFTGLLGRTVQNWESNICSTERALSKSPYRSGVYKNQQNSVSEHTASFTLMISFVFSLWIINDFTILFKIDIY